MTQWAKYRKNKIAKKTRVTTHMYFFHLRKYNRQTSYTKNKYVNQITSIFYVTLIKVFVISLVIIIFNHGLHLPVFLSTPNRQNLPPPYGLLKSCRFSKARSITLSLIVVKEFVVGVIVKD